MKNKRLLLACLALLSVMSMSASDSDSSLSPKRQFTALDLMTSRNHRGGRNAIASENNRSEMINSVVSRFTFEPSVFCLPRSNSEIERIFSQNNQLRIENQCLEQGLRNISSLNTQLIAGNEVLELALHENLRLRKELTVQNKALEKTLNHALNLLAARLPVESITNSNNQN